VAQEVETHCVAFICADGDLFVAPKFSPLNVNSAPPLVGLFFNGLNVKVILGASNENSTVGLPISYGAIAFAALSMPGLHPLPKEADGALLFGSAVPVDVSPLIELGETKQNRLVEEAHVEEAQFIRM
jgi:hypothetical protein